MARHRSGTRIPGRLPGAVRPWHTLTSPRRGQSLVEFALLLPIFLIMTIGIVDMARIFSANVNLSNSVRKAALWASEATNYDKWCFEPSTLSDPVACPTVDADGNPVDPSSKLSGDPDNVAYQLRITGLESSRIAMRAPTCRLGDGSGTPAACATGRYVEIAASYPETLLTPILGAMFGGQILISSSTTAYIEP